MEHQEAPAGEGLEPAAKLGIELVEPPFEAGEVGPEDVALRRVQPLEGPRHRPRLDFQQARAEPDVGVLAAVPGPRAGRGVTIAERLPRQRLELDTPA